MTSGEIMNNICNELREQISRKYDINEDWEAVTDRIVAEPNEPGKVYNWQIFKFQKAVEFRGYKLNVLILSKRVYGKSGELLYVTDLHAEQWL